MHHVLRQVRLLQEGACTPTAGTAAGSSATPSTGPRPSTSASRMPTTASIRSPPDADEEAMVMLSDILPTGFECGVLNGQVKPGDTVAIVGAGPDRPGRPPHRAVLFARRDHHDRPRRRTGCRSRGPSAPRRPSTARDGKAVEQVHGADRRRGRRRRDRGGGDPRPPSTSVRRSSPRAGRLANIGVHGKPVELHLEKLWDRNITLTTRLVDTVTTPMLLKLVQSGRLQPKKLVTHRFAPRRGDEGLRHLRPRREGAGVEGDPERLGRGVHGLGLGGRSGP